MAAHRARKPRQPVRIGARLKSGLGWSDVVLRNVSPRHPPSLAERSFASARPDHPFESSSLILTGAAFATLRGWATHDSLARPAAKVSQAMTAGEAR